VSARGRAVFLDRDGTLNVDSPDYIKSLAEFRLYPDAIDALKTMHAAGFALVVVTNQSAIARRLTTADEVRRIHAHLEGVLRAAGASLLEIVSCPHAPADGCGCRKPSPALIVDACRRHGLDAARSFMIGDKETDVEAGLRAGCTAVLLARDQRSPSITRAEHVVHDLIEAAQLVASSAQRA
jgi:D-glycero-D-manno-heptose 1,7-bisphosphate phosphatase